MSVTIGIDVGGTTTAGGLVTRDGEVLWSTSVATHRDGPGTAFDALTAIADRVHEESKRRGVAVAAAGIGLAGAVDAAHGTMLSDCNFIRELAGRPVAHEMASRLGVPCFVDNDVNALALGEARFGVGREATSMVVLAIGTEVGAGIVVDDRLVRGAHGWAGELGHVSINFDGPDCPNCGGRGCLGLYLGGRRLADEARRRAAAGEPTSLAARCGGDLSAVTSETVFAAAAAGDPLAAGMVDEACDALAAGIGVIVNALNPELVVITGGVARSLVPLEKDVLRRAVRYAFAAPLEQTRFCILPGDKSLTVRGGAALALYELARRKES